MMRIAAIQMVSTPDVDTNLHDAAQLIRQAKETGAHMVVLPENFALMPKHDRERLAFAEADGQGPIQEFLYTQAERHGIWLIGGTIPLRSEQKDKVRAACMLINDHGERVARYDKIHLFDVQLESGEVYRESNHIDAGADVVVAETALGRIGLTVCYDLRFPELFRRLLDKGAEIFSVPSAFTAFTGKAHWEVLIRARAIENLAFVVAPGQGGRHANGRETHGESMIVDPWGVVLGRLSRGPGVVIADFDRERMNSVRRSLPSTEHRKSLDDGTAKTSARVSA